MSIIAIWEQQVPEEFKKVVINLFRMHDIDFEPVFVYGHLSANDEPQNVPQYLTRKDAAEFASVSTDTIDNWIRAGKIKASKLAEGRPGAVRIESKSLVRFLNKNITLKPNKRIRDTPRKGERYRVN